MSLFQLPPEILRVGQPTPFSLRDRTGIVLMPRGTLVASEAHRQQLVSRDLFVDEKEGAVLKRAIAGKLDSMVRGNALLGHIAAARPDASDLPDRKRVRIPDPVSAWSDVQMRLSAVMHQPAGADFQARLQRARRSVHDLVHSDADASLFVLVHDISTDPRDYSVRHAMLVAAVCELAAGHLPSVQEAWHESLGCAALSMNVAMTQLQDQLAVQAEPVTPEQRAQINDHSARSVAMLREAGITDPLWLGAVEGHHASAAGALGEAPAAQQLARLIQRADIFGARMSPRRNRPALSGAAAAKAAYLDERGQADEAGSAIIKATGIYPPGSLVRLANGEVAVVLRRGRRANQPEVASVMSAAGNPLGEPAVRNTQLKTHEVTGGVAPGEVRLRLNAERLLKLQ
jgi:HD-GYP domain-containing protein (c-di-GMP phosphodiesterase class II)